MELSIFLRPSSGFAGSRGVLQSASLGYLVAASFWDNGIATEAVRMAILAAFEEWPDLERVEAIVNAENPASAGFPWETVLRYLVLKGEIRYIVMYSIVSSNRDAT